MKTRLLSLVILMVFSMSACKKQDQTKNIIAFIDFSDDPDFPGRVDYYTGVIANQVMAHMRYGDHIVVLPIDKGTLTDNAELADFTLNKESSYIPDGASPLDEDSLAAKALKAELAHHIATFKTKISLELVGRKKLTQGTDIISALRNTPKYEQAGKDNTILFFSDMMNWSATLKMEPGHYSAQQVDVDLKTVPAIDGRNCRVLVHTGNETALQNGHFEAVNLFWSQYFKQNHFSLQDYSSTSVSAINALFPK